MLPWKKRKKKVFEGLHVQRPSFQVGFQGGRDPLGFHRLAHPLELPCGPSRSHSQSPRCKPEPFMRGCWIVPGTKKNGSREKATVWFKRFR